MPRIAPFGRWEAGIGPAPGTRWHRRVPHSEGPTCSAADRTIEENAMSAAGIGLYGLALVRHGLGEPRVVAQLGAGGRGIGPWETDCLDLTSGEEFTVSSTDPAWEARRIAVTDLPATTLKAARGRGESRTASARRGRASRASRGCSRGGARRSSC